MSTGRLETRVPQQTSCLGASPICGRLHARWYLPSSRFPACSYGDHPRTREGGERVERSFVRTSGRRVIRLRRHMLVRTVTGSVPDDIGMPPT